MPFATSFALAISLALSGGQTAMVSINNVSMPEAQTVEQYVREYFQGQPVMIEIARCESRFKQFNKDGSIHRGVVNAADLGVMQVNEYYHNKVADKLGLDLYTMEGNVAYAKYLYEKEGTTPWISSSPCWSKSKVAKQLALNI